MSDLLVQGAGILGIAAALVHGYLGETKLFASARIEPRRARLLLRAAWHCSVVAWLAMGVLLILVPTMGSEQARAANRLREHNRLWRRQRVGLAWASLRLGVALGCDRPCPCRDVIGRKRR
jgi:hypothetical protein